MTAPAIATPRPAARREEFAVKSSASELGGVIMLGTSLFDEVDPDVLLARRALANPTRISTAALKAMAGL